MSEFGFPGCCSTSSLAPDVQSNDDEAEFFHTGGGGGVINCLRACYIPFLHPIPFNCHIPKIKISVSTSQKPFKWYMTCIYTMVKWHSVGKDEDVGF